MAESEDSMSTEEVRNLDSPLNVKKPKKRSIIERELETNLTSRVTSPILGEGFSTSRYGRARRLKTDETDKKTVIDKSPNTETTLKSPSAYKMHAMNSSYKTESPKHGLDSNITKQIDSIYQENISLSRFNDTSPSPAKKSPKVYTRKDLIQTKDTDDDVILIKNLFSPSNSNSKTKVLDSTEKCNGSLPPLDKYKNQNGIDNASVVKTLDFDDNNKGKKKEKKSSIISKNESFEIEAKCPYQVGDLAWARMGTFPFWPCIVTRDPQSGLFVRNKLFGRVEHNILHVTFFGDNGRRSWIVDNMLRQYQGLQEFESTRDKFTAEDKKKDPRLYAAFFISEKKQPLWNISVEEAELLMKEPKRFRIDILNDMIYKARDSKKQQKSGKISRTNSDVSLSESLYDSLFSEDDTKTDEQGRLRSRSRNHISFDVSEVVTACLDNMAAKTGITKIQRQSHMDRWLQKAKSKTPEKPLNKVTVKTERNTRNTRSRNGKAKKRGVKSATTTDESNLSDQDVKNIQIKTDFTLSEETATPMLLYEDVTVKLELIEQENDKDDEGKLNDLIINGASADEVETSKKSITTDKIHTSEDKVVDNQTIGDEIETNNVENGQNKTDNIDQNVTVDTKTTNEVISANEDQNMSVENIKKTDKVILEEPSQNDTATALNGEIKSTNDITELTENKEEDIPGNPGIEEVPKSPEITETIDTTTTESKEDTGSLKDNSKVSNESDRMDVSYEDYKNVTDRADNMSNNVDINNDQECSVIPTAETKNTKDISKNCEPMEVETSEPCKETLINIPISPEILSKRDEITKTIGNSPINSQNNCDEKNLSCNFLGERLGVKTHPGKSDSKHTSNFLDDDHNHLRDKNKNYQENNETDFFLDKDEKNHVTDTINEKDLKDHECDRINKNFKINNEMSIDDSEDNILDKINDILNESGESESILQTGTVNFDGNGFLNDIEKLDDNLKPNNKIETNEINKGILNRNEKLSNEGIYYANKEIVAGVTVNAVNRHTHERIAGSSTPKENFDANTENKEIKPTIPEIEEYEIEDSDDEPSPEYEPLGEDITEDFRQYMKCIENSVTDRKDEKQIVKICDEITKTTKPEIIDSSLTSPKRDLTQEIVLSPKEHVSKLGVIAAKPLEQNVMLSPQIKAINESTPPLKSERRIRASRSKDKSSEKHNSLSLNKSKTKKPLVDLANELSPKKSVNKEIETLDASTTPHRTRSRTKKFDVSKQENHELKSNHSIENGEIVENHIETRTPSKHKHKSEIQINGPIQEIYSKMCQNVPKVMLTPLKTQNYVQSPETPDNKNRKSAYQFKLSLKKVKSPDSNQTDFYTIVKDETKLKTVKSPHSNHTDLSTIVKDETKRKEPIELPIENGLETTIPVSHQNGYHHDEITGNDAEFDIHTASVNSDDSDESVIIESPRRNLRTRNMNTKSKRTEFLHYLELRQDYLMDEFPEFNEEEIEEYLHRTWEYEESLKCDVKKSDDMRHSNLVKGVKQESPKTPEEKKSKKTKPAINTIENYFRDRYHKKKLDIKPEPVIKTDTNLILDSQPSCSNSSDSGIESNKDKNEMEVDVKSNTPPKLPISIELTDTIESNVSKILRNQIKEEIIDTQKVSEETSTSKRLISKTNSLIPQKSKMEAPKLTTKEEKDTLDTESLDSDSEIPLRKLRSKVVKEKQNSSNSLEVRSVAKLKLELDDVKSVDSDDEPLNKHSRKKNTDKKTENSYENPDFVKFLELRQDALIDENPELSQEEIIDYLYKTWVYEESSKSELKENDEIEQSYLVKGLNQDSVLKTVKQKPRIEKVDKERIITDDDVIPREKPRRKTVQPFYNEEFYSDLEDQIELFEIFRKKPTVKKENKDLVVKYEQTDSVEEIKRENTVLSLEATKNDLEIADDAVEILDSWESYFADLLKPKPNVFKGLIREKVCEICERTGNLYKCKSCNGMFHHDCLKKPVEIIEINTPNKGRKKKRKLRTNKSLEHSESQEEKCQDSESPQNDSIEELTTETCTFDAETIDAQLTAKMQEILNSQESHYDSYSSDDGGIDWTETVPGKCEIIDVKLKPKKPAVDYSNLKCNNCQEYGTPVCFVCKLAVSKNKVNVRQKCHNAHCHKYYHLECLDQWPQTQFLSGEPSKTNKKINEFFEALSCPQHVCHTCVSDDPRGCKTRFSGDKLARCVRCPATYHSFTKCLPAGTQILTASQIICPRHNQHRPGKVPCHVNTGWCFICALGGSLICCEYCPTSFHAECLNIKPPEGNYMCEDCETGRLPLYGEMVWVKLGHYRWWPGIILHPSEIPENIMAVKHGLGEFVVRFFGQYDHYWVNRGRVFPYQEGDSGRISNQKTKIDADFTTAMEHAQRAYEILKNANPNEEESLDIASSLLPPRYVKLKCNKPCGSLVTRREDPALSLTQCECNPDESDPCGPYSQCLNRMLLTECGPTCRAGDRCNNRAFEKRLYPKLTPYRTPHRGWGLKTLEDIKAGQFIIEYVGELIDEEEFRRRMRRKHEIRDENFYFLTLDKERMIDAGPKGNLARFMNHCCEPNCETQKWTVLGDIRVGLFAINDIPANSEVTFNYNLECAGIDKKRCMCGAKRCAGYIGAKPKQDETQTKKSKDSKLKRAYKKRKTEENNKTNKQKKPLGRPPKPKELTEIEKDLLIIKSATPNSNGESSTSSRSQSIEEKTSKLKRKRDSIDDEKVEVKRQKCNDVGD